MLRIATPGAPASTPSPGGTLKGLQHAHSLGINAMELEWVQSVPKNIEHVSCIAELAKDLDIVMTVHAPYFVNLNAQDPAKLRASIERVVLALTMAQVAGAVSVCVHPAFYLGLDPKIALENVRRATDTILKKKAKLFPDVNLAYETMGKPTQFGTLEEVLILCKEFDLIPCIDPAHLHARTNGAYNSKKEWEDMLDQTERVLGKRGMQKLDMHFSGIAYGPKGEKHHLPLRESDAEWETFLSVLHTRGVGGVLVC